MCTNYQPVSPSKRQDGKGGTEISVFHSAELPATNTYVKCEFSTVSGIFFDIQPTEVQSPRVF